MKSIVGIWLKTGFYLASCWEANFGVAGFPIQVTQFGRGSVGVSGNLTNVTQIVAEPEMALGSLFWESGLLTTLLAHLNNNLRSNSSFNNNSINNATDTGNLGLPTGIQG